MVEQYAIIGLKKADTGKKMIGRLCFLKVSDPESRTLLWRGIISPKNRIDNYIIIDFVCNVVELSMLHHKI